MPQYMLDHMAELMHGITLSLKIAATGVALMVGAALIRRMYRRGKI